MKVVVDTNVFISGVFFGGKPQRVLEKIVDGEVCGLCSVEILNEYRGIVKRMVEKKGGTLDPGFLNPFYSKLQFVAVSTVVPGF
jgi:putative PIN family toxin of toxin-antitoxin system